MTITLLGNLIGGIGLFLLGMRLMTDGLKYAAGKSLRDILASSTSTPLRGIFSGAFLTSLVQSSSAVTVATIGFVNAGLMDLTQAITLVYGCNIGTTMTSWLVSLVGFHVNVKYFALPAIGFGMFLRIIQHESQRGAFGDVLAGFGIFFLGIQILKTGFAGVGDTIQIASLAGSGFLSLLFFVGIGFLLTLLMQSSSASIAIILTATAGSIIPLDDAAAVVIGANVGTTSTAALAVLGATPNAKRLAGAHVIFNIITGLIALLLLPFLLVFLSRLQTYFALNASTTTLLAMFHTTFNLLGILTLYPMTGVLVRYLNRRFRTAEEDEARPQYLDRTVVTTPILALHALGMELKRMGVIARRMAGSAISSESGPGPRLTFDKTVIDKLVIAVAEFGNMMQRGNLPVELSNQLPNALRVSGYYNDVSALAISITKFQATLHRIDERPEIAFELTNFKKNTINLLDHADADSKEYSITTCKTELENLKEEYRGLKARLLRSASKGQLPVTQMVNCLELIARLRRVSEQAEKGARYLSGLHITEETLRAENGAEVEDEIYSDS